MVERGRAVDCLEQLGVALPARRVATVSFSRVREEWLHRLLSSGHSESALAAYRVALADLARWLSKHEEEEVDVFSEQAIVAYLADYRRRARPALRPTVGAGGHRTSPVGAHRP